MQPSKDKALTMCSLKVYNIIITCGDKFIASPEAIHKTGKLQKSQTLSDS